MFLNWMTQGVIGDKSAFGAKESANILVMLVGMIAQFRGVVPEADIKGQEK